jgi:hypothetical protein
VTSMSFALNDSSTMLRRNLLHMVRYPSMTLILAAFRSSSCCCSCTCSAGRSAPG